MAEERGQTRDDALDAQAQARRRLALAQIRQFPDPVLRMQGREVTEFDGDLLRLVERMSALMRDAAGIGLAATQVGVLRRLFVVQLAEEEVAAIVNPRVVDAGEERETDDEGCLSLQGVHVPVERPRTITLEGVDELGRDLRLELEDLAARAVQHELDHLDGVLILDRTTAEARREALATLRPQPSLA